jgi:hypothetical protein
MSRATALLLASFLLTAGALIAADAPVPLQPLQAGDVAQGCRFSFSLQPQLDASVPAVFALDLSSGEGLVRVDGTLIRLTRISSEESRKRKRRDSVGDRYTEVWASDSLEVTIRYKTTFVCPEADTTCTITSYKGQIAITHGGADHRLEVWGSSGCPNGG